MKQNNWVGIIFSIVGIATGILLFYLLSDSFMSVVQGKITSNPPRPDEAIAVKITYSILGWLGIGASGIWAAVLYGFIKKQDWAYFYGKLAAALQILAGFFPMIPAKSIDLPAATMPVFILAFILWIGIMIIGKVNKKVIILLLFAGMAYVLNYMNGVAIISKFQTTTNEFLKGMFATSFGLEWGSATLWLIFSLFVLKRKKGAIPLGIMAAVLSIISGYTLAITNITEVHRFSMFLPAPIISTGLLIYICFPAAHRLITQWE